MGGCLELRLVSVLSLVVQSSSLMPVFLLMTTLDCCLKSECFSEFFLPGVSFYERVEPLELFVCCI